MTTELAVLAITDGRRDPEGRPLVMGALQSLFRPAGAYLDPVRLVVVNDADDETFDADLAERLDGFAEVIHTPPGKAGFAGAIRAGWEALADHRGYVVHLEDDFRVNDPGDFLVGREILERHPRVAQIALKRNAVSKAEHEAGGQLEARGPVWSEVCEEVAGRPTWWIQHREYFTTNPSIYPARIMDLGWPDGPRSEEKFSAELRRRLWEFGYFGKVDDRPRCEHVARRSPTGTGY